MRAASFLSGRVATLVAAASMTSGLLIALPPNASASWLQPANLRILGVTSTSFTVSSGDVPTDATGYRLYASTNQADVWWDNLDSGTHSSALVSAASSSPTVTISGLTFSSATWYFRMEATNSTEHSYSANFWSLGLRPDAPTNTRVHSSSHGTYLTWDGMQPNGYDVQQATDAAMTQNVETFPVRAVGSAAQQFTPGDLSYGQTYYWRVRGWNSATTSSWTAPVSARAANHMYPLRLMTYNLLNRNGDGEAGACGVQIAAWANRKAQAAGVVASYNPDIIGLQEGGQRGGTATTQAQDLASAVRYRIAGTGPQDPNVSYAGNYIAYNPATYRTVGSGGHWMLDSTGVANVFDAVYQEFQPQSGPAADILVVDTHLPPDVGSAADQLRYQETTFIIQKANALAALRGGIPVVYTGDWNSFPSPGWHPFDAPPVAMHNAGISSDAAVARYKWNAQYASRNRYCLTPPADGINLDYLYVGPGVAGGSWGVVLRLNSNNQFNLPIPSDHNPVAGTLKIPY